MNAKQVAIVTGANGFLGRNMVVNLAENGYKVYAVIRSETIPKTELLRDGVEIIYSNMCDYDSLHNRLTNVEGALFFHFAWADTSGVGRSNEEKQLENVQGACNSVRLAVRLGCKRFIMPSSIMEYEISEIIHTEEKCSSNHIYSIAKMSANYLCKLIAMQEGMEYVSGIISNIYGPGEETPRFINSTIRSFLKGNYVKFSKGDQLYDFIYISDAINCFRIIAEKGKNYNEYYIGNEKVYPLKEFIVRLAKVLSCEKLVGLGEIPFYGKSVDYSKIHIERIKNELSYENDVSFEKGIILTADWINKNKENGNGVI